MAPEASGGAACPALWSRPNSASLNTRGVDKNQSSSREKRMRKTTISLLASAALICLASAGPSCAQSALTGTVSSTEEGPMEGVLVTAR
jgi:hypothetical protein